MGVPPTIDRFPGRCARPNPIRAAGVVAAALTLAACGTATGAARVSSAPPTNGTATVTPATLSNCGMKVSVATAPARAVTMNQSATEVMLALGLADRLAGTAYLDDAVLPRYAADYARVPVLAQEYPGREALLKAEPDFVYAAYPSAFEAEAAGSRADLAGLGIASYLSPAACPDRDTSGALTIDQVWQEIADVGALFGVRDRAAALVAEQRQQVQAATADRAGLDGVRVLWWDGGTDAPTVGACCGAPAMIMSALGLTNAFDSVGGGWGQTSWEAVAKVDPDVIILVDASWDTAGSKRAFLAANPVTSTLRAVRAGRTVDVSFSATTPGVRNASAVGDLAGALRALPRE